MTNIDIIIVNWNAGRQLRDCLESIVTAGRDGFKLSRVVVVDNASSDGSVDDLGDLDLPLTIIRNDTNRGFAAACNQGAKGSGADYLLFLNPDTRLFEDSLIKPLAFMEQSKNIKVGICGIRLLDELGNMTISCARFPTLRIFFGKMTGLSRFFPKLFPNHLMASQELLHSSEVDQVIGAFFLVRKNVYDENKGFDERFFVYFEEVDFSLEAKLKGYSSYYFSDVSAYHRGDRIEQVKATKLFYSLRSRIQYGFKHYSYLESVVLMLSTLSVELIARVLLSVQRCSFSQLTETMSAYKRLFVYLIWGGLN